MTAAPVVEAAMAAVDAPPPCLFADPAAMAEAAGDVMPAAGWPVSDAEFDVICRAVLDTFDALFESVDDPARDTLLCDFRFVVWLTQYAHAQLVLRRSSARGIAVRWGVRAEGYYRPDWQALGGQYHAGAATWRERVRSVAAPLGKAVLHAGGRFREGLRRGRFAPVDALALGSRTPLRDAWLRETGLLVSYPSATAMVTFSAGPDAADERGWREILAAPVDALAGLLSRRLDLALDAPRVSDAWARRLAWLGAAIDGLKAKRWPARLLLSELGNPRHRVAAAAARRAGATVTGFHHGNSPGHLRTPVFAYVEAALCHEFICPSPMIADAHRVLHDGARIARLRPARFASVARSTYATLLGDGDPQRASRPVTRVMVMGYPFNAQRYLFSAGDFFALQLGLERRLCAFLRDGGFEVVYKAHPQHAGVARALLRGVCDAVEARTFETVWQEADAFVFGCTTTTTFGFSLATDRRVVVIDLDGLTWNPAAKEILAHRCAMVPARFDANNEIEFDSGQLLLALGAAAGAVDRSAVARLLT